MEYVLDEIPMQIITTEVIIVSRISHILSSIFLFIGISLMNQQYRKNRIGRKEHFQMLSLKHPFLDSTGNTAS